MARTYKLVECYLNDEDYLDIYNDFKELTITPENNDRLYRAIADSIMNQEGVDSYEQWVRNHYKKSTVCTIFLDKLGYSTRKSKEYISNRSGILGIGMTTRNLIKILED